MGNTNTGFDWGKLLSGLGGAAASYGIDRLKKQDEVAKQKKQYDMLSNSMNDQMSQYQDDYASELSGTLTPQEIATRDAALTKTRGDLDKSVSLAEQQLTQQYSRAGIGGEELSKALQELRSSANQQYLDYETNINIAQLEKAANRQSAAKAGLTQIKGQVAQTLTPLQVQLETAQAGLDKPETMDWAKYLLPGVAAAGVAGIGQMTQPGTEAKTNADGTTTAATQAYSGPTAEQAFSETSLAGMLQTLGLDPKMFQPANSAEAEPKALDGSVIQAKTTTGPRNFLGQTGTTTTYENKGLTEGEKTDRMKLAQGEPESPTLELQRKKMIADESTEFKKAIIGKKGLNEMDPKHKQNIESAISGWVYNKIPAKPEAYDKGRFAGNSVISFIDPATKLRMVWTGKGDAGDPYQYVSVE